MSIDEKSAHELSVRCPSCRQTLSVPPELMDRIIECGACDARFRLNNDVIIHSKKFYPDESKKDALKKLARNLNSHPISTGKIEKEHYRDYYNPELGEPTSPLRVIAGAIGIFILLGSAFVFLLSSSFGNTLFAIPQITKLFIASFIALVALILLIFANPRAKLKAGLIGCILGLGLVAIPYFLVVDKPGQAETSENNPNSPSSDPKQRIEALRKRFLTEYLELEQERLIHQGSLGFAYGIYITNLQGRYRHIVSEFLIRETEAASESLLLKRGKEDFFMQLTAVQKNITQVAEIAARLGSTLEVHPEIGVVVITVDNNLFVSVSQDELNDRTSPLFYEINSLELQSIDLNRIQSAVDRLVDAKPVIFRADITKNLIELLGKPSVTFHNQISLALLNWAEDIEPAAEVGLVVLKKKYASQNIAPPESLVKLVSRGKLPAALPVLKDFWLKNPTIYEKYLSEQGEPAESVIIEKCKSTDRLIRHSAIKILGQIGTSGSLADLRELLISEDPETIILAQQAIKQIESR